MIGQTGLGDAAPEVVAWAGVVVAFVNRIQARVDVDEDDVEVVVDDVVETLVVQLFFGDAVESVEFCFHFFFCLRGDLKF